MAQGKINIDDMKKKYLGFAMPCYSIEINDKPIDELYCIDGMQAEICSGFEAGRCVFEIKNAFYKADKSKIEMAEKLRKLLKLGNRVSVKAGYKDCKSTKVFSGYIDSIYLDYNKDGMAILSIECLDGKGLMMNSLRSESMVSIKKYSEAVEKVLKKYSPIIKVNASDFDKTDDERTIFIEQHNESDYDFVVRIAKNLNSCFYINENGNAVFKPFSKLSKDVLYEFDINEYMLELTMNTSLRKQVSSVSVVGGDIKEPSKTFSANVSNYKSIIDNADISTDITKIISPIKKTISDMNISTQQEAEKKAQAVINEISYSICAGRVKVVGLPELTAGSIVSVNGFGEGFDKKYFVSKVTHKIKNNIYTTECDLEVNKTWG